MEYGVLEWIIFHIVFNMSFDSIQILFIVPYCLNIKLGTLEKKFERVGDFPIFTSHFDVVFFFDPPPLSEIMSTPLKATIYNMYSSSTVIELLFNR